MADDISAADTPLPSSDTAFGAPQPIGYSRLEGLDFTRGVAVMGILAANIVGFGQPFLAYTWPGGFATPLHAYDNWLWLAQFVLIDGKMRGLFTLLFGAGLVLFVDHAERRGDSGWRQVRRLAGLMLFGLAHYFLLWRGDILTAYAACGIVALLFLRLRAEALLAVGLIGYFAGALVYSAQFGALWADWAPGGLSLSAELEELLARERADGAAELLIARNGSYFEYVEHAVHAHASEWLLMIAQVWLETLPLMLIGMALYRFGLFDGSVERRTQLRWGWIGVATGSLATAALGLWVVRDGLSYSGSLFAFLGPSAFTRLPVVIGLAALLAVAGQHVHGRLGRRTIAAGRMAFSNYIGTSLAMLFVFQPPGLRLFGQLGRVELYLVVLLGCGAMLAWSKWWLARFNYGPLEWVWRCMTYGRRFPLKRH